mgnify:CR=1 FL=1
MDATIIESWPLFQAMFWSHWLFYVGGPIVLFRSGHPVAGGIVMLIASIMPLAGQAWFTNSDAVGLGFLLMLEFPIAALVFAIGAIVALRSLLAAEKAD